MSNPWNSEQVVEAWRKDAEQRARTMGKATELMLQAARVKVGGTVLDVAAGMGEQSMMAAQLVGPDGKVVATDISENMLKLASELAKQRGISNITTMVMNAEQLEFLPETFNSIISRHGLMLIPDLQRALTGIYQVLKKDAWFASIVWSKPENNPAMSIPMAVLFRLAGLQAPSPGRPGIFSLGDPEILFDAVTKAGFREVKVEAVPHFIRASSAKEFLQARRSMASGTMGEALTRLSEDELSQATIEMLEALEPFEGPNGFEVPGESLLVYGTK